MANTGTAAKPAKAKKPVSRFAHPFFTTQPTHSTRFKANRMSDWIQQDLGPIPKPKRNPVMTLSDIVGQTGAAEIQAAGALRFHATGDTGKAQGDEAELVASRMSQDYDPAKSGTSPAFFLHLGDVIYGPHKDQSFRDEFYRPYTKYPGKIVAIPGNHDGEIFQGSDPVSLRAFQTNFCTTGNAVPNVAAKARILRETISQPGVYWWINAPYADIIGLYTNYAEGPGFLEGGPASKRDKQQITWLNATLKQIADARNKGTRKALVVATHHPPFSNGGGHSGSPVLLQEVDDACKQAGLVLDAFLSGHSHSYQRHTRKYGARSIPFITCGVGGRGLQHVESATGQLTNGVSFDKSASQYGYLELVASAATLKISFWAMQKNGGGEFVLFDSVNVPLN